MISVSKLYKDFKMVRALDGLSLNVERGIFGLIGPNGAGKTTLIRILVGLLRPDSGKGQVFGFDIKSGSVSIRRRIGILHEKPAFPGNMEVQDYLKKVAMIYNSTKTSEEMLSIVSLSDAEHRKIGDLSAGMLQRLGIAQALIGQPDLVILDEPTSNLDVNGRDDIVSLIVELHNELDVSFFISSHILSELERACHQVAFIKAGRIVERGSVLDIINAYTKEMFIIITSDSKSLFSAVSNIKGISQPRITGANAITIRIEKRSIEDIRSEIEKVADSLGARIYAIEKAATLENAYRGIMD
jgi:ABC-type multidrug transport system ATPase subunit